MTNPSKNGDRGLELYSEEELDDLSAPALAAIFDEDPPPWRASEAKDKPNEEHIPTLHNARIVYRMACAGVPLGPISAALGLHKDTLKKYYGDAYGDGKSFNERKLVGMASKIAGKYGENPAASFRAIQYLLGTRHGYKEGHSMELTGPGGGPVETMSVNTSDPIEASRIYSEMINKSGEGSGE